MNIIELYTWIDTETDSVKKLYGVLGTTDLKAIMDALSATGAPTCDAAFKQILAKSKSLTAEQNQRLLSAKKLLQQDILPIYHGNKDKTMVPRFGAGKPNNDFGQGFYTTPNPELGKEWAYSSYTSGVMGYLHSYNLDLRGLNVLNMLEYDSLAWVAELFVNRGLKTDVYGDALEILTDTVKRFISAYKLNTDGYDVIIGYRADDSYFKYVDDFAKGMLYRETLDKALLLGDLGLQVFIKSEKAFKALQLVSIDEVDTKYATFYSRRDKKARDDYNNLRHTKGKTLIYNYIGGLSDA